MTDELWDAEPDAGANRAWPSGCALEFGVCSYQFSGRSENADRVREIGDRLCDEVVPKSVVHTFGKIVNEIVAAGPHHKQRTGRIRGRGELPDLSQSIGGLSAALGVIVGGIVSQAELRGEMLDPKRAIGIAALKIIGGWRRIVAGVGQAVAESVVNRIFGVLG